MALITYTNKETINENTDIPAINKCQASDMNEIKSVVNANYQEFSDIDDYIVETGGTISTNFYEKYASGKMIQWGRATITDAFQTQNGVLYRTANVQKIFFVEEFIDTSNISLFTPQAAIALVYNSGGVRKDGMDYWANTLTSAAGATRYVFWMAIGRWK